MAYQCILASKIWYTYSGCVTTSNHTGTSIPVNRCCRAKIRNWTVVSSSSGEYLRSLPIFCDWPFNCVCFLSLSKTSFLFLSIVSVSLYFLLSVRIINISTNVIKYQNKQNYQFYFVYFNLQFCS